jgi:transcriptional regulator with XRE-family HTH domain
MNIKIGAKIKMLRKRDDITQERLADILSVTSQAISKWESESGYPDIEYITPIANFFNVTTDYLFDHDMAEKRKKIDGYCEEFDINRKRAKLQERVDMMRQALAEFPAEEQLLFRLAKALYDKWQIAVFHLNMTEWRPEPDYEKHRSFDGWEEAVKIMEELLSTSIDDSIRSECRELLAYIYGKIGEKEKVLAIAEKCDDISRSKENILAQAICDKDQYMYGQKRFVKLLTHFTWSFIYTAEYTQDKEIINEAYNMTINLFKFIFSDGNYGLYNDNLKTLYNNYAWRLRTQGKIDEAFEALENTYSHAKMFDIYLRELRKKGVMQQYTSPFVNLTEDDINDIYGIEWLPLFLDALKDENTENYKFHGDPRYTALIKKIETDIAAK